MVIIAKHEQGHGSLSIRRITRFSLKSEKRERDLSLPLRAPTSKAGLRTAAKTGGIISSLSGRSISPYDFESQDRTQG